MRVSARTRVNHRIIELRNGPSNDSGATGKQRVEKSVSALRVANERGAEATEKRHKQLREPENLARQVIS